jgi:hypothetical protein
VWAGRRAWVSVSVLDLVLVLVLWDEDGMGMGWAVRKGKERSFRLRRGKEEGGKGIINID